MICDRVAIINHGVIARQGKLTELLKGGRVELSVKGINRKMFEDMKISDSNVHDIAGGVLFDVPEESDINAVIDAIRSNKGSISGVVPRKKRLEDLFVETVTAKNKGDNRI